MHRQLSKLELSKIDDNELPTNNDNKNESQEELCSFRLAVYSLCFNAAHYNFFKISFSTKFVHTKIRNENENENEKKNELVHYNFRSQLQQQLPTVTFKKKKEQLDNLQNAANFYSAVSKTKLQSRLGGQLLQDADSALRGQLIRPLQRASTGACQEYPFSLADSFRSRIEHQLSKEQLRRRDLQTGNFSNSSLAEETFNKTTSQTAAWQKRASDKQLLQQQLGRRELEKGNFRDSSLEEETFSAAASKKTAWKRHFAFPVWQTGAWQLSLAELQTRTLTPELSQLERTALHTELAELKRPALQTELEKLQPSSLEASFPLGGGSFKTSPRRGGVLSSSLPAYSLTFISLTLGHLGSSFVCPLERSLQLVSLAVFLSA